MRGKAEERAVVNTCPCGGALEKKISPMRYRDTCDPSRGLYGEIIAASYWECGICSKKYLSPQQFTGDFCQEVSSNKLQFFLRKRDVRDEKRLPTVRMAAWLKD